MTVPRYVIFVEPILRYLALRESRVTSNEACEAAARALGLSNSDRTLELNSGGPVYRSRAAWAFNLLKRTGLAEAPAPGEWQLTTEGPDFARACPVLTPKHLSDLVLKAKPDSSTNAPQTRTQRPRSASASIELGNRKAYRLPVSPMSVGGQAAVFVATRKRDNKVLILKSTREIPSQSRMRREIEIQSALDHPNVMPILDWDPVNFAWYVMPRGTRVLSELSRPVAARDLCRLIGEVATGLEHAHMAGHPHRDLKPPNIIELSDENGLHRWVVADWGLTRRAPGETTAKLTQTGQFLGTLGYAPPEAYSDAHNVGPPGDVYALGQVIAWGLGVEPVPMTIPTVPEPWRQLVEPMTKLCS